MRRPNELGLYFYFSLSHTNLRNNSCVVLLVRTGFYPKVRGLIALAGYCLCPQGTLESGIQINVSGPEFYKLTQLSEGNRTYSQSKMQFSLTVAVSSVCGEKNKICIDKSKM